MPHNLFAHLSAGEWSRSPASRASVSHEPRKCCSRAVQVLLASRTSVPQKPCDTPLSRPPEAVPSVLPGGSGTEKRISPCIIPR